MLSDQAVQQAAISLNDKLRMYDRNGRTPDADIRQAAAEIATAVPLAVVNLSWLLKAAGPEVAAAVRAQARAAAGSAAGLGTVRLPSSVMSATEAAGKAGVSDRAIRAACAKEKLAGSKSKVTGEWQIAPEALDEWMRRRRHAA